MKRPMVGNFLSSLAVALVGALVEGKPDCLAIGCMRRSTSPRTFSSGSSRSAIPTKASSRAGRSA